MRNAFAILLGLALTVALVYGATQIFPPQESLQASQAWAVLTCALGASIAGGFITAVAAREHEQKLATAVSLLLVGIAVVLIRTEMSPLPKWFLFAVAGIASLATTVGAQLRLLTKRKALVNR